MFEPQITLTIEPYNRSDHVQIAHIAGQLDKLGLEKVREDVEKLVQESPAQTVILDCAGLEFLNSESIGFLVGLHTHLQKGQRRLQLINMNNHIREVLSTVGLLTLFSAS